ATWTCRLLRRVRVRPCNGGGRRSARQDDGTVKWLLCALVVTAGMLVARAPMQAASPPSHALVRADAPAPLPSPDRLLAMIRRQFRSHRPPPPYVTYTLVRSQTLDDGYPDLVNSYTYHIWCRTY